MAVLKHECVQVVNRWPFRFPVLGFFARLAGYLSVNEMSFEELSRRGEALLAQGVAMAAFPEGTRSGCRAMNQFHGAMFRLALKTGVPVVPMAISGNEDKPAKGTLAIEPGKIVLHKLKALYHADYKDLDSFKFKNMVRQMIAAELEKMES